MPTDPNSSKPRRVTEIRRDNPVALPPAHYQPAPHRISSHKVGKSGAIHIASLPRGANVNVVQVDEETFVVSSRPESDLRELAQNMPKTKASPFAKISLELRGLKHDFDQSQARIRRPYAGPLDLDIIDDETALAGADTSRSSRRR